MANRSDRIGQRFGDYVLQRRLGGGSFGDVYLGEQIYEHSQAAVKVLHIRLTRSEDWRAFINEVRTFRLQHPHIVRVLDVGIAPDETPFLVMAHAPGGTLRDRHPKGSRLSQAQVLAYVLPIASALQYAHDRHLIHRDVKPENMLLGTGGALWLSDFGIVTVAHSTHSLTAEAMGGTAPYMAPEQIQGRPRPQSDQYALAVVVYEWLTGSWPFRGTALEIAMQQQMTAPPPLRTQVPTISPEVEHVVLTALAKDPKERFASMLAFATAFEQASQVTQLEAEPEPVVPVSEMTEVNQSQQPTEMATPGPGILLSQQTVSEGSADLLPQAEAERRQAEGEGASQAQEQADKLEAERARKAQEAETAQKAEEERARKAREEDQARKTAAASPSVSNGPTQPAREPASSFPSLTPSPTPPSVLSSSLPESAPPLSPSSPTAAATPGRSLSASNGPTQPAQEPEVTPSLPTPSAPVSNGRDADPPPNGSAEIRTASQDHAEVLTPPLHAAPPTSSQRRSPVRVLLLVILAALLIGSGGLVYTTVRQNQATTTANATATSRAQANATATALANSTATALAQANVTATAQASIPGRIWHAQHSGTAQPLYGVAWSGSQFVAVGGSFTSGAGTSSTILTSPDGRTWTTRYSGTGILYDVAWSGSQFVVVGNNGTGGGTILTSPDGRTWTAQPSSALRLQFLSDVAWSGSQFVVVGASNATGGGTILTSPDGRTWTAQPSSTSLGLWSVAWLDSQFVAVGGNGTYGTILTSPDGRTWTARYSGTSPHLNGVAWSGSQFVVVGGNGTYSTILTSPDGRTWTARYSGSFGNGNVAWSGSQFVVVGNQGVILTSPDGRTWTAQPSILNAEPSSTSQFLSDVIWSGSRFVAVGNQGVILTSP